MCISIPISEKTDLNKTQVIENRISIMKKHKHYMYSEEQWGFFKEWYKNYYPDRKYYE